MRSVTILNGEYSIKITKAAQKDKEKIKQYPALKRNVQNLIELLKINPFQNPPPYEKLVGSEFIYVVYYNQKAAPQIRSLLFF